MPAAHARESDGRAGSCTVRAVGGVQLRCARCQYVGVGYPVARSADDRDGLAVARLHAQSQPGQQRLEGQRESGRPTPRRQPHLIQSNARLSRFVHDARSGVGARVTRALARYRRRHLEHDRQARRPGLGQLARRATSAVDVSRQTRTITTNDLPEQQNPRASSRSRPSDPAYQFDPNPNHVGDRTTSRSPAGGPHRRRAPSCTGLGPIGVLNDGVLLYNALDDAGRDAVAHETQDECNGHPDGRERYHYHDVPCASAAGPPAVRRSSATRSTATASTSSVTPRATCLPTPTSTPATAARAR